MDNEQQAPDKRLAEIRKRWANIASMDCGTSYTDKKGTAHLYEKESPHRQIATMADLYDMTRLNALAKSKDDIDYLLSLLQQPASERYGECEQVEWRAQQDRYGCVLACLAMITGKSYEQVKSGFASRDWNAGGTPIQVDGFAYLAEHGFALQPKYIHYHPSQIARNPWPLDPFAPLHLCEVVIGDYGHAVVMLTDGTVLDPRDPQQRRLTDYEKVNCIAGVFPTTGAGEGRTLHYWTPDGKGGCLHCDLDVLAHPETPKHNAPATVAEGEGQEQFDRDFAAWQDKMKADIERTRQSEILTAEDFNIRINARDDDPPPVQPPAAPQDEKEPITRAERWLSDYDAGNLTASDLYTRCLLADLLRIIRAPSTTTPGEGAREELVALLHKALENPEWAEGYIKHAITCLSRHFPPTEATQVVVEAAAQEIAERVVGSTFENTGASHETLRATMIERIADYIHGESVAAIISKHGSADAGEVERLCGWCKKPLARRVASCAECWDEIVESLRIQVAEAARLRIELTTTRANAIRECVEVVQQFEHVHPIVCALELLTKKEGDDGPTDNTATS